MMSDVLSPEEALKENDNRIVKSLWNLFDQSDIIIAHNAQKFDVPKMNARFVINGLTPPSPYRIIDTLLVARKQFRFTSNKLDDLAGYFNIEHKKETSFELWDRCVNGDQESLKYMEEYNMRDVEILEQVYLKLRPWIKNHPNLSLYIENKEETCPYCGSTNLFDTGTFTYTNVSKFSNVKCSDCHAISRRRTSDYPKEKRKNLITST
jgi:RNase P subunit RPR2